MPLALLLAFVVSLAACGNAESTDGLNSQLAAIWSRYPELKDRPYETAEVKRVVDGDTFETAVGDKVRLIGMNTPETVKPNSPVEAYGKEASAYTKKRLTGRTVLMFADVGDKDKYGRKLRYVFIEGEAEMFNMTLVREGYAGTMTVPPNVMFAKAFVEAEREARNRGAGLWADPSNGGSAGAGPGGKAGASGNDGASGKSGSSGKNGAGNNDGSNGSNSSGGNGSGGSAATASCSDPKIKGNMNSKREKIYHVPGGRSYAQTKAEVMFCTEEEAVQAGFRKAEQ
jgi:micrococcal nuclease